MSDLSNWADIGQHLFDRYCIEGVDEDFCRLAEQHDKEVIQNYIDKVVEELEKIKAKYSEISISIDNTEKVREYISKEQSIALAIEIVKAGGKNE